MGHDAVAPLQQAWFNYETPSIYTRFKNNKALVLRFYPFFFALVNVAMVCSIICFTTLRGYIHKTNFRVGILLGGITWAMNAGFTIFASSAALRFQAFPLFITTIFSVFLLEWIWKAAFSKEPVINQLNSKENSLQNAIA